MFIWSFNIPFDISEIFLFLFSLQTQSYRRLWLFQKCQKVGIYDIASQFIHLGDISIWQKKTLYFCPNAIF